MRGKAIPLSRTIRSSRITPAYAGKSLRSGFFFRLRKDHPRLCGEKREQRAARISEIGSPPPMRGKVVWQFLQRVFDGITPAYAGKRLD